MLKDIKDRIAGLLEQSLRDAGCELADIVLSQYKSNTTVRLFVYADSGPTIDECSRLSRIVGELIDGTDYFKSGYTLEVSSPGLDRPLKTVRDFKYHKGEQVRVEFVDKKRKKVDAEIVGVTDDQVMFRNADGEFAVDLADIDKAKIIF